MYAQRVYIFHAYNREAMIVFIADYLEFNFFPAFQRFFHQDLCRVSESTFCQSTQFCFVFADTATHTAQRISGTDHYRETDLVGSFYCIVHRFHSLAYRSFYVDFI